MEDVMVKKKIKSPTQVELLVPTFEVLVELGGSATINEIYENIIKKLNLPEYVIDEPHNGKASQETELEYQLAWARTRLKNYGAITNSKRGTWIITPEYADKKSISRDEVVNYNKKTKISNDSIDGIEGNELGESNLKEIVSMNEEIEPWKTELGNILREMNPYAFERLSQLVLRESGFYQVNVTKKSGDGGIDGTGKLRINGMFSFNVAFQCKRYTGSVSASAIRDFRGSLTTDIEKGIFITTSTFTRDAQQEACVAGKKQIDLIDGKEFIDKLIEFRIGVKERTVFEVDPDFFDKI